MKDEPIWLNVRIVEAVHQEILGEYGGSAGVRESGLIESALARPLRQWMYQESDVPELAALYAHGIVKNHGFVDGNKRTAAAAMGIFLDLNGWQLDAPEPELVEAMVAVATGEWNASDLSAWIRDRIKRSPQ